MSNGAALTRMKCGRRVPQPQDGALQREESSWLEAVHLHASERVQPGAGPVAPHGLQDSPANAIAVGKLKVCAS